MGLGFSQIVICFSDINNITIRVYIFPLPSKFINFADGRCLRMPGDDRPSIDASDVNI